ncbi:hypothetical protein SLEP1_g8174 [Rubroshorea leprosula]|uniref:Cyclin-dependent kinase inhibitor n=1 Tax=Rubroshorea leprosula TaxID=152421 RepID=A0AAV5IA37_9ROSI|nr:hypothetical protein SLEP1_g8174 [Rubroshorea leprosula]
MVKKCRAIAKIAVVEMAAPAQVGVRTRARALAMATTEKTARKRKRKLNHCAVTELELSSSSTYIQLRNRRIVVQESVDHRRLSSSSDQEVSCCSSNGSSERIELPDLEAENFEDETSTYSCSERRETTESDELDSTSKPSAVNCHRRSAAEKMPTEAELQEFFTAAEKDLQKQFVDKYNYDIVKDEPLDGRFEWVRLKP